MQDLKKASINRWPVRMGDASRGSLCCWMGAVRTTYLVFKPLNWYFFNSNKVWEWQLQEFYSWRKLENNNNHLVKWTAHGMIASKLIKFTLHTEIQLGKFLSMLSELTISISGNMDSSDYKDFGALNEMLLQVTKMQMFVLMNTFRVSGILA